MSLEAKHFSIAGPVEITPARFGDDRGFFSETFNAERFATEGIALNWVQDNHALSARAGIVRGLHFQRPPYAQAKLVRVCAGSIFDVVVDIRTGSPTFGQWLGVTLSVTQWNQLFVPPGFAHGYVTLEANTQVLYKVSAAYAPAHEGAIRYDDPAIGIAWPEPETDYQLSAKDLAAGSLADAIGIFGWPN